MTSRARKRLKPDERRAKILSAAVRAFAREGYDGATMDDIALGAKITKPVLYDHFASKRELFAATLESIRDDLLARGQAIAAAADGAEAKFRRSADAFFQFVEESPQAARVLLTVPSSDPVAARLSRQVQAGAAAGIAAMLATSMPSDANWRVRAAAEFIKEGLHAVAVWWLSSPGPSRQQLVDLVTDIVWTGLERAPKPAPARPLPLIGEVES